MWLELRSLYARRKAQPTDVARECTEEVKVMKIKIRKVEAVRLTCMCGNPCFN